MARYLKPVFALALLVAACLSGRAAPGDQPISRLPAMTNAPTIDDLLVIVDDPNGTPITRKVTVGNAFGNAPNVPTNIIRSLATNVVFNTTNFNTLTVSNLIVITNATEGSINASAFGVKGDGRLITRCAMTAGSRNLTCSTAAFTSADVGKVISVYIAGGTNLNLTSIITNVGTATSITLSNPAVTTVGNVSAVYGSDDTVPIQNALNAMASLGLNLFFNEGIYVIAGPLRDLGTNSLHHNAQLFLPDVAPQANGFVARRVRLSGPIPARGRGRGNFLTNDLSSAGAVLFSTLVRGPDVNPGRMLSCKNFTSSTAVSTTCNGTHYDIPFNNINVDVDNLSFYSAFDNNIALLDLSALPNCAVRQCLFLGGFSDSGCPQPTGTNGFACLMSGNFTENLNVFDENEIYCFYNGLGISASVWGGINWITTCYNGVNFWDAGGVNNTFGFLEIYESKNAFFAGADACETHIYANASLHNNVPGWWQPQKAIVDPGNAITGWIGLNMHKDAYTNMHGLDDVISGALNLEVNLVGNLRNSVYQPSIRRGAMAYQSSGPSTVASYTLGLGADFSAMTMTANTLKAANISFSRYQDTNYDACDMIGFLGFNADTTILDLGTAPFSSKKGANRIDLFTAQSGALAPVWRWSVDGIGRLFSKSDTATIGDDGFSVPRIYGTNIISAGTIWANQIISTNQNGAFFNLILEREANEGNANMIFRTQPDGVAHSRTELGQAVEAASLNGSRFYIKMTGDTENYEALVIRTNGEVDLHTNVVVDGTVYIASTNAAQAALFIAPKSGQAAIAMTNWTTGLGLFNLYASGSITAGGGSWFLTNAVNVNNLYVGFPSFDGAVSWGPGDVELTNRLTTRSISTSVSNKNDTVAISVTASVFHWTNTPTTTTGGKNVFVFIDGNVATTASLGINSGTTLYATKSAWTIPLQPGESFDLTYTGSAPTARWKPW